jgi:hypothetical protein
MQYIADSPYPLRRTKGRRGLDVMQLIQKMPGITVRILDHDFPKIQKSTQNWWRCPSTAGKDRHQRLQSEQGSPVQGNYRVEYQRTGQFLKPVVLPGEILNLSSS